MIYPIWFWPLMVLCIGGLASSLINVCFLFTQPARELYYPSNALAFFQGYNGAKKL